jgi:hypothetical protein
VGILVEYEGGLSQLKFKKPNSCLLRPLATRVQVNGLNAVIGSPTQVLHPEEGK